MKYVAVATAVALTLHLSSATEPGTRLLDAVKAGDRVVVQKLLKDPAQLNATEADGITALDLAVRSDNLEMAGMLLRAGANPKASNRYGITPLSLAVTNGNPAMVDALLAGGADAKATVQGGQTILMTAARVGNAKIVQALLVHGAEVDARESTYGETALIWAAAENHPEAIGVLVEHGANVNIRTSSLQYPADHFGLEGVNTILAHGNWTPLMYAARQGSLAAARALADAHAQLNAADPDGTTPLLLATSNGHYDTAAMLVEHGADPNQADSAGMGPLYAAADMNTLGEVFGRPHRNFADKHSPIDLMKVLIDHGANPNAQLKTPTLQRAHTPGEGILGAGSTPLMRAARNGDSAAIKALMERGADPEITQRNGTTALMLAAGLGRNLGSFADDYATDSMMLGAVKVLLDRHVNINAAHENGRTALHFAALSMDSVVKVLAEDGAILDVKDKQGHTPLDMALGQGGRGRAGALAVPRESTAALLRELMGKPGARLVASLP